MKPTKLIAVLLAAAIKAAPAVLSGPAAPAVPAARPAQPEVSLSAVSLPAASPEAPAAVDLATAVLAADTVERTKRNRMTPVNA